MGLFNDEFDQSSSSSYGRPHERDELMRQIKILNDKVQRSNDALKREESEKYYERMIMHKTHETQLEIKNSLIHNLEDIIDEQEARIFHLQSHVNGIGPLSPRASKQLGGVTRLRNEIEELAKRNVELHEALLREQQISKQAAATAAPADDEVTTRNGHATNGEDSEASSTELESKLAQSEKEKLKWKTEAESLKSKYENLENVFQKQRLDFERLDVTYSELSLKSDRREREWHSQRTADKENYERTLTEMKREKLAEDEVAKTEPEEIETRLKETHDQNRTLEELASTKSQDELLKWKSVMVELEKQLEQKEDEIGKCKTVHAKEVQKLKDSISKTRRESTTWQQRHADAVIALDCFRASLKYLRQEQLGLIQAAANVPTKIEAQLTDVKRQICSQVSTTVGELASKYKKEILLRKQYHNQLVELKGNIRVFARVRPIIPFDTEHSNVVEFDENDDASLSINNNGRKQVFTLDKVFGPQHAQADIFSEVQPLITSVLDGYNVCIFAYGQTGSGKTYTMEGPTDNPGINQRALAGLFEEIGTNRSDWSFQITVSMLEIYNESIHDLLSMGQDSDKLDVKMNPEGLLHVPGLTWIAVDNLREVNHVFQVGRENRATASTNMNEHSSRSHALLCVNVAGIHRTTGVKTHGRLNLVDLAGSERVSKSAASGDRLKEAQCINKSLSALGDVIWALKNQHQHIPFRNSKLTYLLQDSLAGNSKTLMVVQVAPVVTHASETVCSLNFGHRVRSVELGQAVASRTPAIANGTGNGHQEEATIAAVPPSPFQRTPSRSSKRNGWR